MNKLTSQCNFNNILKEIIYKNPKNIVFLCGAGISLDHPSSLPTVNKFISQLLRECNVSENIIDELFNKMNTINYRFESLIYEIQKHIDNDLLVSDLFKSDTYNTIHSFLANMLITGSTIITTNFDNCIENAISDIDEHIKDYRLVYYGKDLNANYRSLESKLIKIHGSKPLNKQDYNENLVITIKALAKTANGFALLPKWKNSLLNTLNSKTVIVFGYSASDDFDITPLLIESNPEKIIWFNYDVNNQIPVETKEFQKVEIKRISYNKCFHYFNGKLVPFLNLWAQYKNIEITEGKEIKNYSIYDYVNQICDGSCDKIILSNEVLLSYGLYSYVKSSNNEISELQYIRAQYRLGNFDDTITNKCEMISHSHNLSNKKEALYYLSSIFYYKKEYEKSLKYSANGVYWGWKTRDIDYYLNSLINYASISMVYAFEKKDIYLDKSIKNIKKKYNCVLRRSKGNALEAEANSYWGLGEISRCFDNNMKVAKKNYLKSKEILQMIGNSYAIEQLDKIIYKANNNIYN